MAERVGFEPTIRLPVCRISSAVLSTTQPPLRSIGRRDLHAPSDSNERISLQGQKLLDSQNLHTPDHCCRARLDNKIPLGGSHTLENERKLRRYPRGCRPCPSSLAIMRDQPDPHQVGADFIEWFNIVVHLDQTSKDV